MQQPRARGSKIGVRSPAKYGSTTSPSLPAGTAAASSASASTSSCARPANQSISSPADDIPAATEYVPGARPEPAHSPSCATGCATVWMKKSVDPYITIVSPTSRQPAL